MTDMGNLERARAYEELNNEAGNTDGGNGLRHMRPLFHLSTRIGWMNDPNGFSFYKGKYHLFYQYHPYDMHWGPMHWGHAVSNDLIGWESLPAALAPDEAYDEMGCFSGSALTHDNGEHLLMYTGVSKDADDGGLGIQTQCIAFGDGVNYKKYAANPVIGPDLLPDGCLAKDFRDPKIIRRSDGTYMCLAGCMGEDGNGQILIFESQDAISWSFKSRACVNDGRFGKMWECPDLFMLDDKWVLLISQTDSEESDEYKAGHCTLCLIGSFDEAAGIFNIENDMTIDGGPDFYAPQTLKTDDGRRVMIGWLQSWEDCDVFSDRMKAEGYDRFGQMSVPRELFIRAGRLCQRPIRELKELRANKTEYTDVLADKDSPFSMDCSKCADISISFSPAAPGTGVGSFAIRYAISAKGYSALRYNCEKNIFSTERIYYDNDNCCGMREIAISDIHDEITVRFIMDINSAEIFINDGERTVSQAIYDNDMQQMIITAQAPMHLDVTKYDIVMK